MPACFVFPHRRAPRTVLTPLVGALLTAFALAPGVVRAQSAAPAQASAQKAPIELRAREIRGRPDRETVLVGEAELRRAGLVITADRLSYDHPDDLALARGQVRATTPQGDVFTGTELRLHVQRLQGYVLEPTYHFARVDAGGSAKRIDFIDDQNAIATGATYTSCTADGGGTPAWILTTDRVKLDFEANEGIAEGAVLRFMGVPILGAPVLSFPLTDARKSGWLPPSINLDSKSGLQVDAPYYWNIAPNLDATFTPGISAKRGASLGSEFRYLAPRYEGRLNLELMPHDELVGRSRHAAQVEHLQSFGRDGTLSMSLLRVSDNDYWKDFDRNLSALTPRLLPSDVLATHQVAGWTTYAHMLRWQVLQSSDGPIVAPYERAPQIGARTLRRFGPGLEAAVETELNRFTDPQGTLPTRRPIGTRAHVIASIARPWVTPGWSIRPTLSVNAASYDLDRPTTDGRRHASRAIPTFSLDTAWQFERDAQWRGRALRQTLEPRLLYVNTPYREQRGLPNFDSAGKDFNFESIYTENAFSGVDRVSDANQLTAGVTTRLLDADSGEELLRLGIAQRYLFRDQLITPQPDLSRFDPALAPQGPPLTQKLSDMLLLASTSVIPRWTLDASVQYSPENERVARSILGARYSPGPFRTVNARYRLTRGLSEQFEVGWQWPLNARDAARDRAPADAAGRTLAPLTARKDCGGTWYGVGRINYSTRDRRLTDAIVGFEYDAGCWIGRVVAERLSTGRSEATTRLLFQLELVGLSRLGSNPLQVLKDNVPGYRLLRDDESATGFPFSSHD